MGTQPPSLGLQVLPSILENILVEETHPALTSLQEQKSSFCLGWGG